MRTAVVGEPQRTFAICGRTRAFVREAGRRATVPGKTLAGHHPWPQTPVGHRPRGINASRPNALAIYLGTCDSPKTTRVYLSGDAAKLRLLREDGAGAIR